MTRPAAAADLPNNSFTSDIHQDEDDDDHRLWIWEEKEVSSLEVDMELMVKRKARRKAAEAKAMKATGSSTTGSPDDLIDDSESSVSSIDSAVSSTHGVIHDMVSLTSKGNRRNRHPYSFTIPTSGGLTPSPLGRSRRTYGVADDSDEESSLEGGVAPPRPPVRNASSSSGSIRYHQQQKLLQRQTSYSKQSFHATTVDSPRSQRAKTATMLGNLMMEKDWEGVLDVLESSEGADAACSWHYGTSSVASDPTLDVVGGMWKRLPLHHACCLGAPIGILDKLLEHYPEALEKADPYNGMMPLHLACQMTASAPNGRHAHPSPSVVGALLSLKQGIKATKHPDSRYGRLPLHWACISAATIVEGNSVAEASSTNTDHHQTRMLTAANKIISRLLQVNPSAVIVRDEAQDMTPLEYATGGVSSNNMKLMEKLYTFMNKVRERSKSTDPMNTSFRSTTSSSTRGVLHQIGAQQLSITNISFHKQQQQQRLPPATAK